MTTTKVSIPHSALAGAATPAPATRPPGHRPVQHYLWRCWPSLASSSHRQPCLLCLFCLPGNILGQHLINFAFCGKCVPFHVIYNKIQYFTLVSRRPHKVDISPDWQSRQWSPVSSSRARSSFTSIHVFGLSRLPHNSSSRDFCRQPARTRAPRRRRAGRSSWTQLTLAFLLVRCGAMTSDLSHPTHLELI